jgi:peptide/nickel transport system permease protein
VASADQTACHFWLGTLVILLFARYALDAQHPATPTCFGLGNPSSIFPSVTLGVAMAAVVMRTTRSAMLDVLGTDYIRTAHARVGRPRVIERTR